MDMPGYNPLISVLIASYNHEQFLQETLNSIWKQGYPNVEIVVVDDCSTDGSWDLLQHLAGQSPVPIIISRHEINRGPSATFNEALAKATGELAAFVASDDVFVPRRFTGSVELFAGNPALKVVFANGRIWDGGVLGGRIHRDKAIKLLQLQPQKIARYLYTNSSPLFIQAALFKRQVLNAVGGFDNDTLADDWLLNSRLFASFSSAQDYAYLNDDVVIYRQHAGNLHKKYERHERQKIEFIERHTPQALKPEGFSNIYYWAAQQRLKRGELSLAWDYYRRSQRYSFHWLRTRFALSWLSQRVLSAI